MGRISFDKYSESEELNFEGSLNDFDYLFKGFIYKPPTLKEALLDMFENAGLSEEEPGASGGMAAAGSSHGADQQFHRLHARSCAEAGNQASAAFWPYRQAD